jgi:hypothetical protein
VVRVYWLLEVPELVHMTLLDYLSPKWKKSDSLSVSELPAWGGDSV